MAAPHPEPPAPSGPQPPHSLTPNSPQGPPPSVNPTSDSPPPSLSPTSNSPQGAQPSTSISPHGPQPSLGPTSNIPQGLQPFHISDNPQGPQPSLSPTSNRPHGPQSCLTSNSPQGPQPFLSPTSNSPQGSRPSLSPTSNSPQGSRPSLSRTSNSPQGSRPSLSLTSKSLHGPQHPPHTGVPQPAGPSAPPQPNITRPAGPDALPQPGVSQNLDVHVPGPIAPHPIVLLLVKSGWLALFWAVLGVAAATVWPIFVWQFHHKWTQALTMVGSCVVTIHVYALAYVLRMKPVMRDRRNWTQGIFWTLLLSIVTILTSVLHGTTYRGLVAQIMASIAVFSVVEIGQPIFDYGLLQYYLRLPVQTTIQHFKGRVSAWHFFTVGLLIVATVVQGYFLHLFQHEDAEPIVADNDETNKEVIEF